MAIINESEMLEALKSSKRVLLIEPPYRTTYPPLGLCKISSFVKRHGGQTFYSRFPKFNKFDLICVATVFTSDAKVVSETILRCQKSLLLRDTRIIVGGVFASLMPKFFEKMNVDIFTGVSDVLDSEITDYSLFANQKQDLKDDFKDATFLFTTRGCPNKCGYCVVSKIEPESKLLPNWKANILIEGKPKCVVIDNNILAFPTEHLLDLAITLKEGNKKVLFENGLDCHLITDEVAEILASLKYFRNGFRSAFDRMTDDGHYQKAMEKMTKAGFKIEGNSFSYVLFNFNDTPQEAYYRARQCWKYKSNPYIMKYRPFNTVDHATKEFVGKHWTKNLVDAFLAWGRTYGYKTGDCTFESWVDPKRLNQEDWDKWYYDKEKYVKC